MYSAPCYSIDRKLINIVSYTSVKVQGVHPDCNPLLIMAADLNPIPQLQVSFGT